MESKPPILDPQSPKRKPGKRAAIWKFWIGCGVLICLVVTAYIVYFANPQIERVNAGPMEMRYLKTVLGNFELDNGRYPTTAEGLDALLSCPPGLTATWRGPYLERTDEVDKWGHPYHYSFPSPTDPTHYDLHSLGPDGIDGTADDIYKDWD